MITQVIMCCTQDNNLHKLVICVQNIIICVYEVLTQDVYENIIFQDSVLI